VIAKVIQGRCIASPRFDLCVKSGTDRVVIYGADADFGLCARNTASAGKKEIAKRQSASLDLSVECIGVVCTAIGIG
jgi:trans-2-enoyl-CoA reductase